MQVVLAKLKLGGLVRYVPYPVHAGYMNGVAVVMIGAMLPHLLGLPLGTTLAQWQQAHLLAPVIARVALYLALRPHRWTHRVPPYLTALLAATLLHHFLALTPLAAGSARCSRRRRSIGRGSTRWRRLAITSRADCCTTCSVRCCLRGRGGDDVDTQTALAVRRPTN
jgi:MFS superfamily sulfate permease-like transporter